MHASKIAYDKTYALKTYQFFIITASWLKHFTKKRLNSHSSWLISPKPLPRILYWQLSFNWLIDIKNQPQISPLLIFLHFIFLDIKQIGFTLGKFYKLLLSSFFSASIPFLVKDNWAGPGPIHQWIKPYFCGFEELFILTAPYHKLSYQNMSALLELSAISAGSKCDLIYQHFPKVLTLSERVNVARNVSVFIIEDIYR